VFVCFSYVAEHIADAIQIGYTHDVWVGAHFYILNYPQKKFKLALLNDSAAYGAAQLGLVVGLPHALEARDAQIMPTW
jgi:hypothetical protein